MLIVRLFFNAIALILTSMIVPGFSVDSFWSALVAAVVLGVVNVLVRPILLLLTLPVNVVTLGLFTFVVNALMLLLVTSIVKGFSIDTFGHAFLAAVVLWVVSMLIDLLLVKAK